MNKETEQLLTLIVSNEGDCVLVENCVKCPFFKNCTGTQILWSREKRIREAIDLLFNEAFLDE